MNWKGSLILLGIFVLIAALTFGMYLQNQQLATMTALLEAQASDNATRTQQLQTEISQVRINIDQQSSLINRALGKVVPIPISEDIEKGLLELDALLSDPSTWPADQAAVQAQFNALGSMLENVPTWVQEELFPRIVPARWGLDALWYLRAVADDDEARLALIDSLESLQRNQPRGASPAIVGQVAARVNEIESDIREADEATASQALDAGLSGDATLDEILAALDVLADEGSAESSEQLAQLERRVAVYIFQDGLSQVDTQLTQALALTDETLKLAALSRARDTMIELQLRIASARLEDRDLDSSLVQTNITTEIETLGNRLTESFNELKSDSTERRAQAVRDYQVWALEKIKAVRPYDEIKDEAKKKNPNDDLFSTAATQVSQRVLREEMVSNLSQIDVGVLDVAVGEWFRKVYSDRFDKLNDQEKLKLVHAFANSTKLGVGEHP